MFANDFAQYLKGVGIVGICGGNHTPTRYSDSGLNGVQLTRGQGNELRVEDFLGGEAMVFRQEVFHAILLAFSPL